MKRQRSTTMPGNGTGTARLQTTKAATKKKAAKTRVGQGKEEEEEVVVVVATSTAEVIMVGGGNQMKNDAEFVPAAAAAASGGEIVMGWDDWPGSCSSWVAVDEQMSWGTCWSPSWDMEFIDGEAYHALYDDVVWEDDIWDLKDIKNVPSSQSLVHDI